MTGFSHKDRIFRNELSKYAPDLRVGIHQFVLYEVNGLIAPTIFGDKLSSILRTVTVRGKPGDIIEESYSNPIWVPVVATEIDDFHFKVMTMHKQPMLFHYGSINFTLVFRKSMGF